MMIPRDEDVEHARLRIEQAMNALAEKAEQQFDELWRSAVRR